MATFWKIAAHSVDHMFSICILTICNISYLPFGFWGLDLGSIASVSDLCILFTFTKVFYSTLFIGETPRTHVAREPAYSYIDHDASDAFDHCQNQNQNSLLVKRQNDNTSSNCEAKLNSTNCLYNQHYLCKG